MRRARRNPLNWVGPVCIVVVCTAILLRATIFGDHLIFSVVLFDYLLFTGVLGWSMKEAAIWRARRHDLSIIGLSGLSSHDVALIPVHCQLAIWRPLMFLHLVIWGVAALWWLLGRTTNPSVAEDHLFLCGLLGVIQIQFAYVSVILAVSMGNEAAMDTTRTITQFAVRFVTLAAMYILGLTFLGVLASLFSSFFALTIANILGVPNSGFLFHLSIALSVAPALALIVWLKLMLASIHTERAVYGLWWADRLETWGFGDEVHSTQSPSTN